MLTRSDSGRTPSGPWSAALLAALLLAPGFASGACPKDGVWLQVLGSGGPEADDGRSSSGYLVWQDGRGRVLVDLGGGSMAGFEQAGAQLVDLEVILISHFHVDHSNDLPALVKASWFTPREDALRLYGPSGNDRMPGASEYAADLIGPDGAFRYLSGYLDGRENYRLFVQEVEAAGTQLTEFAPGPDLAISAVPVHHGPNPALAWRVEIAGTVLVFSGDMSGRNGTLPGLAKGADLLVAHNAVPEGAGPQALALHMPPSVIGRIAGEAEVRQLVLSHRMKRSLGREDETLDRIRESYHGPVHFADDLQCFEARFTPAESGR